jgi:XTP/dITP diphosphohydrolase
MNLLIGTHNKGKLREYRELLAEVSLQVVGLDDIGLHEFEVEETGDTFEDNARLKALAYAQAGGMWALADDSGLMVDALDGRPGLHSARFGQPGMDERDRRLLLLSEMQGVPAEKRTARFVCVIAVAHPNKQTHTATGVCEGRIVLEEDTIGKNGFGYDPVFIPEGYDQTFASLPQAVKHRLSHRGRAIEQMIPILKKLVAQEES